MSYILLKEILGMPPASFEWLDVARCIFKIEDQQYGIFVESFTIDNRYNAVNISFGRLSAAEQFHKPSDIDTTLSGTGRPRFVLSTVSAACLENVEVMGADIVCLAASDEHSAKRGVVYSIAASELRQFVPGFRGAELHTVRTSKGSVLTLLVKRTIPPEDVVMIMTTLDLTKD